HNRALYSFPTRRSSDLAHHPTTIAFRTLLQELRRFCSRKPLCTGGVPMLPQSLLSQRGSFFEPDQSKHSVLREETSSSLQTPVEDRKSTRLNSSHVAIS